MIKKIFIATLLLLVVTRIRKRGCDPMKEGDWVVCDRMTNRKGEKIHGYIKKFYDGRSGKEAIVRPINFGFITSIYVGLYEIGKDDSRHPDDVQEMIDWALADNDKIYFREISQRQEVVK
jgi:hypothetical protein